MTKLHPVKMKGVAKCSSSTLQIVLGCRDFVSPLSGSKLSIENSERFQLSQSSYNLTKIFLFFFSCSDSVKSKKYDLPTAASVQAMRNHHGKYGTDDEVYFTEV